VDEETAIVAVGRAIQLSVAPVFLLSGIGAMLAVMTNRLARIVDRARTVEERLVDATPHEHEKAERDLRVMSRRARCIYIAITLCTITALFVCAVVATMFLGAFIGFNAAMPVAVLFVGAMTTFFVGLVFFLREIFLATAALRIGGPR
jgi:Na+/melibiose symporter-like transporter